MAQVDAENVTAAPRLHGLRKEAEKIAQEKVREAELEGRHSGFFPKILHIFSHFLALMIPHSYTSSFVKS
jgi:hypothetical protein